MQALRHLGQILNTIAQNAEVLPAVGGAIQDLAGPDPDELADRAFNEEERVFDTIFERDTSSSVQLYRHVPPLGRSEAHLFRYFLDGSFRSYFLGTILEQEHESPVHFAQVGVSVIHRIDDGSVRRALLQVKSILLVGKGRLSSAVWDMLEGLCSEAGIELLDLTEKDLLSGAMSDYDLRSRATGKVRFAMHNLEAETIRLFLPKVYSKCWLVVDGSLLFQPTLRHLSEGDEIKPVIGVAKSFRKDPQFVFGRGPRAERRSIYKLLVDLQAEHRTAAFSARGGSVVFWYVRLREQAHLDYPLMGVVKVELANPAREPVSSEFIDMISRALTAERSVTPHGQDRRWHAHLYPIFLAECAIKEGFMSAEAVQQFLKWR